MKKRIFYVISLWTLITICAAIAYTTGIDPPAVNVVGAYVSSLLIAAVLYKTPEHFYIMALCFDLVAVAFGSVLDFYRSIEFCDLIVHFMSGLLAAEGGRLMIGYVLKRYRAGKLILVRILFALFFSCACAGIWEIYEFTADQLIHTSMQGNNFNTMGDIVSGVRGAIAYTAGYFIWLVRERKPGSETILVKIKNKIKEKVRRNTHERESCESTGKSQKRV